MTERGRRQIDPWRIGAGNATIDWRRFLALPAMRWWRWPWRGSHPNAENSLVNQYSGVMSIWNDHDFYSNEWLIEPLESSGRLQIHSGPRIPSNILSEVDRKIDDGIANSGDMVFNAFDPSSIGGQALSPTAEGGSHDVPAGADNSAACMNAVVDFAAGAAGSRNTTDEMSLADAR